MKLQLPLQLEMFYPEMNARDHNIPKWLLDGV